MSSASPKWKSLSFGCGHQAVVAREFADIVQYGNRKIQGCSNPARDRVDRIDAMSKCPGWWRDDCPRMPRPFNTFPDISTYVLREQLSEGIGFRGTPELVSGIGRAFCRYEITADASFVEQRHPVRTYPNSLRHVNGSTRWLTARDKRAGPRESGPCWVP